MIYLGIFDLFVGHNLSGRGMLLSSTFIDITCHATAVNIFWSIYSVYIYSCIDCNEEELTAHVLFGILVAHVLRYMCMFNMFIFAYARCWTY